MAQVYRLTQRYPLEIFSILSLMKSKHIAVIILVLLPSLGGLFLFFERSDKKLGQSSLPVVSSSQREVLDKSYPYINKTKVYELGKHYIIDFTSLKKEIVAIQKKYPHKTYIYFDYLNNGSWIGIGEREEITAASLVKVPLAMAVYKAIEERKFTPEQRYALSDFDLDSNFGDLYKSGADSFFTIEDLVKIMLEQSDNTARSALYTVFSRIGIADPLADVYSNLGWDFAPPLLNEGQNVDPNYYNKISLKVLSNMFLSLYNATYVNLDNSQKILDFLANSPYNDKIRAGVPKDIAVSHKIGTAGQENTFSDCGIVYSPNRHYMLCIGSINADEKTAAQFMAEISKAVYVFVITN